MKIGFVGMGKLGFPCALAAAFKGHDVVGFDENLLPYDILASRKYPHREERAQELLDTTTLRMVVGLPSVVAHSEIIFVAVQTPHRPEFEGLTRMPEERSDFDYSVLVQAVRNVAHEAREQKKPTTIVVISTALPGTCRRVLYPLLNEYTGFIYNPFFIAMGTTIPDYLRPEYVLLGYDAAVDKVDSLERVRSFYNELHGQGCLAETVEMPGSAMQQVLVRMAPRHQVMSVESAELTKVGYNVFLGLKIVAANSIMEIAHKIPGANCDDVTNALALATDRVVSSRYMRGGMGDGGGCHPRDQIALAWLADELDLSYDLFGAMVKAREAQTEFLADLCDDEANRAGGLPIVILGKAYKKGTNLTYGSPAILLKNILDGFGLTSLQWDPHVDGFDFTFEHLVQPGAFVVATNHDEFYSMKFPQGSVVIDPWGKMADQPGVRVVRVGRGGKEIPERPPGEYLTADEIERFERTRAGQ